MECYGGYAWFGLAQSFQNPFFLRAESKNNDDDTKNYCHGMHGMFLVGE